MAGGCNIQVLRSAVLEQLLQRSFNCFQSLAEVIAITELDELNTTLQLNSLTWAKHLWTIDWFVGGFAFTAVLEEDFEELWVLIDQTKFAALGFLETAVEACDKVGASMVLTGCPQKSLECPRIAE